MRFSDMALPHNMDCDCEKCQFRRELIEAVHVLSSIDKDDIPFNLPKHQIGKVYIGDN